MDQSRLYILIVLSMASCSLFNHFRSRGKGLLSFSIPVFISLFYLMENAFRYRFDLMGWSLPQAFTILSVSFLLPALIMALPIAGILISDKLKQKRA